MALSTFSSVRSAAWASAWDAFDVSDGMGVPRYPNRDGAMTRKSTLTRSVTVARP
jgi:hypothetical protein